MSTENTAGYREGDLHLCTGPLPRRPLAISLAPPLDNGAGVVLMRGWDAEETLRLLRERYRGSAGRAT